MRTRAFLRAQPRVLALVGAVCVSLTLSWTGITAAQSGGWSTGGIVADPSAYHPDPTFLALKNAHRLLRMPDGSVTVLSADAVAPASSYPSSSTLDTSWAIHVLEPLGGTKIADDAGQLYTDWDYWNFCSAGGATIAMQYWSALPSTFAAGKYLEPNGPVRNTQNPPAGLCPLPFTGTTWHTSDSYNGRSYLMYMAMAVNPSGWQSLGWQPGVVNFSSYWPDDMGTMSKLVDALNWESSGHNSNYSGYFWANLFYSSPSQAATFNADIVYDISAERVPVLAALRTGGLPNWSTSYPHTVSIVGYDNNAGTYSYVDTCGISCGASTNNGKVWTTSQANLFNAIAALPGGITW